MLSVPFPVITLIALLLLIAALCTAGARHNGALRFLFASFILILTNTLRWEFHSDLLRNLQSVMAIFLPAIAWSSFVPPGEHRQKRYVLMLFVPVVLSLLIRLLWAPATDVVLGILFFSYGVALFRATGKPPFRSLRPGEISHSDRLALFAGFFLCSSALTDLLIAVDFGFSGGKYATSIVAVTQFALLPLVGTLIFRLINPPPLIGSDPGQEQNREKERAGTAELTALYRKLEKQVREDELYLNPDVTLALLARKTGIPARHVSAAVNSVRQCNVSQWINGFRVERAKALLINTALPVTQIMMESGFMTKSNFNREFLRLSGTSPGAYRQQARDNSGLTAEKA